MNKDTKKEARPAGADRAVTHPNLLSAKVGEMSSKIERGTVRVLADLFPEIALADRMTLHKMHLGYTVAAENFHKICFHEGHWRKCDNEICQTNFKIIAEAEVTLFGEVQSG